MVSLVRMDSTGGKKDEKWKEWEERGGGWWLFRTLQGTSEKTVSYIPLTHTNT